MDTDSVSEMFGSLQSTNYLMMTEYRSKHMFRDGILLIIIISEIYFSAALNTSDFMSVKTSVIIFIK
jgi:hypothetical protein